MTTFLKSLGLISALLALISILIGIPAWQFGVIEDPKVIFLFISYFVFFLGTVWRVVWYGKLANRQDDRQVQSFSGRLSSLITIIGLIGFHWFSLYTFSIDDRIFEFNPTIANILTVLAFSFVFASIVISQIAIQTLGKFFDRLTIKTDHRLVTEGIYRFVRHPIYTSYILLFLGFCTMLESFLGLSLLFATCVVWFGNRMTIEEKMLEERFGEEYQSYCQQSKRLFPYIY